MAVSDFGVLPDGRPVRRLRLGRAPGPVLSVLDLGATVQGLAVTCGDGERREVVLGQGSVEDYLASTDYLGSTVGRYANRIAAGRFPLDGREVQVGVNDRGNQLHGGPDGFHRRLWQVEDHSDSHARLTLESPDGDQGFPGRLLASVRYDVLDDRVAIALEAMRMVQEGVATEEDIDTAMTLGYRHPVGPLKTPDTVGLAVRLASAEHLARELGPRFEPPQLLRDKVAAGELGRKTGRGFYDW